MKKDALVMAFMAMAIVIVLLIALSEVSELRDRVKALEDKAK